MRYLNKIKTVCPEADHYRFIAICMDKDSDLYGEMYGSKEEALTDGVKEVGCQLDIYDAEDNFLDGALDKDEKSAVDYYIRLKEGKVA